MLTGSITPSLSGEVWLKSIRYPALNTVVRVANADDVELADRSTAQPVAGRSLPVGVADLPGGRDHVLHLRTDGREAEDALTVRLRANSTVFVHVPAVGAGVLGDLLPGSMYALVRRPRRVRLGDVTDRCVWILPLVEVAPPAPQVTGALLVAETLFRLYGSAQALYAVHSDGQSLLATLADPDDLVVV